MPIDLDMEKHENDIRDLYMSNPLGDVNEYKGRTATETQARMAMFRNRWANTFELIQDELIEPVIKSMFTILNARGIIVFDSSKFDYTKINYINTLSKQADLEEVQGVTTYTQTAMA